VANGNTSSSNIGRVGGSNAIFHNGTESWVAFSMRLDPSVYAFCGTECSVDGDGGLNTQLKQLGSCGTPAGGVASLLNLSTNQVQIRFRNSAEIGCGNATMKTLWTVPIQRGRWIKVLHHVGWCPRDNDVRCYYATWTDTDGDSTTTLRPTEPGSDGLSKPLVRVGDEVRIVTHTMKDGDGVDHVSYCKSHPCVHPRSGTYRDERVSGDSAMNIDGWTIATSRAAAVANAFGQ
jgi:hypothetical protein